VWVNEGAVIEDSIVMTHHGRQGARLRRVIVDRFNIIPADSEIGVDPAMDRRRHFVDPSGLVVVPPGPAEFCRASRVLGRRETPCRRAASSPSTGTSTNHPARIPGSRPFEVQDRRRRSTLNERITADATRPTRRAPRGRHNRISTWSTTSRRSRSTSGPTLFAWLERRREVYRKILVADRASVGARDGHGNAIAQVYNHMILPLASRRDKVTQGGVGPRRLPRALRP